MATEFGNAAKRLPDSEITAEPSMEEILSSIKQIIADDEQPNKAPELREDFTFPENPSNSNHSISPSDEAELSAALQDELNGISRSDAGALPNPEQRREDLETRVAAVRAELSSTSETMSPEERLQHYRSRNKLKTEALAESRAEQSMQRPVVETSVVQPTLPPARVQTELSNQNPLPVQASVPVAPVQMIAAPSPEAVAKEMAEIMLKEKSAELETILADLMRPTIRQWLNDNLPSMVQRLVREEIRAASRGRKTS